jgi:glycosyltransferase involved in cell wall biosynthesis
LDSDSSNLTVVWGCHQGGVETALYYRLKYMNHIGIKSHGYFYDPGMGLANYSGIPHYVSSREEDFIAYVKQHRFEYITFINSLCNMELLKEMDTQVKVIYELHGYGDMMAQELRRINNREDEGMIRGVVVPSASVAEWAKKQLVQRSDIEVYVATNTLDVQQFSHTVNVERLIQDYSLRRSWLTSPLLGWVGRLDSNKNWSLMLDIFRLIRRKRPTMKLLLVSDLAASRNLHLFYAKAAKHGLIRHIRILPNLSHNLMPMYYSLIAQSGGTLISTSRSEGYPYNLLEAQACECPVVCSNINGSKELVQHGVTGFVFSLDEPKAAVQSVQKLMVLKRMRSRMQQNARRQVLVRNDIHLNVSAYIDWLKGLRDEGHPVETLEGEIQSCLIPANAKPETEEIHENIDR